MRVYTVSLLQRVKNVSIYHPSYTRTKFLGAFLSAPVIALVWKRPLVGGRIHRLDARLYKEHRSEQGKKME